MRRCSSPTRQCFGAVQFQGAFGVRSASHTGSDRESCNFVALANRLDAAPCCAPGRALHLDRVLPVAEGAVQEEHRFPAHVRRPERGRGQEMSRRPSWDVCRFWQAAPTSLRTFADFFGEASSILDEDCSPLSQETLLGAECRFRFGHRCTAARVGPTCRTCKAAVRSSLERRLLTLKV